MAKPAAKPRQPANNPPDVERHDEVYFRHAHGPNSLTPQLDGHSAVKGSCRLLPFLGKTRSMDRMKPSQFRDAFIRAVTA